MAAQGRIVPPSSEVRRLAAWLIWVLIGASALVVVGRGIAGAWGPVVSPVAACLLTTALLAASLAAWVLHSPVKAPANGTSQLGSGLLSIFVPLLLGLSLSGSAGSGGMAYLLLLTMASVIGVAVHTHRDLLMDLPGTVGVLAGSRLAADGAAHATARVAIRQAPVDSVASSAIAETDPPTFDDCNVSQQWIRRSTPEGADSLQILMRVTFPPGAREVAVHIPLWPAMTGIPVVDCEPLDASEVELRVTAAHTYGVRIEVRRSGACDEAHCVPIGVQIAAASQADAAA